VEAAFPTRRNRTSSLERDAFRLNRFRFPTRQEI
jgi:hypothetical protein